MITKLAEELKEARLKKDITLQQLFVRTRIDIKFLEAIENGNFDVLPEVYLKAFIKSYASAVGLDETTVIKKFEAARSGKDFDSRHAPEAHSSAHREEKRVEPKRAEPKPPEPKRPEPKIEKKKEYVSYDTSSSDANEDTGHQNKSSNNLIWIALAGVVLIVALLLYLIFFRGSSNQIVTEKPYDEYLEKNSQRFEDTTANNAPASNPSAGKTDSLNNAAAAQQTTATPKSDSLSLLIKSSGQSWIKVTPDNSSKSYEFILQPNMQKSVKAKKNFHLVIGNSGDVKLQLNNSPLNFVGKAGEVRVAQVDSSGLVYSRSSKPSTSAKPKAATDNPVNGDIKR